VLQLAYNATMGEKINYHEIREDLEVQEINYQIDDMVKTKRIACSAPEEEDDNGDVTMSNPGDGEQG
jgi:hypothetical protein